LDLCTSFPAATLASTTYSQQSSFWTFACVIQATGSICSEAGHPDWAQAYPQNDAKLHQKSLESTYHHCSSSDLYRALLHKTLVSNRVHHWSGCGMECCNQKSHRSKQSTLHDLCYAACQLVRFWHGMLQKVLTAVYAACQLVRLGYGMLQSEQSQVKAVYAAWQLACLPKGFWLW